MRLVRQADYRGHTLLMFEQRVAEGGTPVGYHWIVIAPDGVNVLGGRHASETDAREFVDRLLDPPSAAPAGESAA